MSCGKMKVSVLLQVVCYSGEIWKERQRPTLSGGKKLLSTFLNALGHTVSRVLFVYVSRPLLYVILVLEDW